MFRVITLFFVTAFLSLPAQAATCPVSPLTTEGYVTVDTNPASTCVGIGSGNVDLSPLVLLDKTTENNDLFEGVLTILEPSTGQGSFSIGPTPGYTDLTLVIKNGNLDGLQWGAFALGALTGTWSLQDSGGTFKSLSGAELWGDVSGLPGPSPVPVPAAVWLFSTALIGFIGLSRRTKV